MILSNVLKNGMNLFNYLLDTFLIITGHLGGCVIWRNANVRPVYLHIWLNFLYNIRLAGPHNFKINTHESINTWQV